MNEIKRYIGGFCLSLTLIDLAIFLITRSFPIIFPTILRFFGIILPLWAYDLAEVFMGFFGIIEVSGREEGCKDAIEECYLVLEDGIEYLVCCVKRCCRVVKDGIECVCDD